MRPLCTALALITSQFNAYSEGELTPNKAYPYLAMATNLSQVCDTHSSAAAALLCPVAQLPCQLQLACQPTLQLSLLGFVLAHLYSTANLLPGTVLPTPPVYGADVGAVLPGDVLPRLQG